MAPSIGIRTADVDPKLKRKLRWMSLELKGKNDLWIESLILMWVQFLSPLVKGLSQFITLATGRQSVRRE